MSSFRHIFNAPSLRTQRDVDWGQLYVYAPDDTLDRPSVKTNTVYYDTVYDLATQLVETTVRWTQQAPATVRVQGVYHGDAHQVACAQPDKREDVFSFPKRIRMAIPHVEWTLCARVDETWQQWDVRCIRTPARQRTSRIVKQYAPTHFVVKHWIVVLYDADVSVDAASEPDEVPPLYRGPNRRTRRKRRPHVPPAVDFESASDGELPRSQRKRESRARPASPEQKLKQEFKIGGDSPDQGEWIEDDPMEDWLQERHGAGANTRDTKVYGPPVEGEPRATRERRAPLRWGYDEQERERITLGISGSHRGPGAMYTQDYDYTFPQCAKYGVSTMRESLPGEYPGYGAVRTEEFYFEFPEPEFGDAGGLSFYTEVSRTPPPAEEKNDSIAHGVFLCTYLAQAYVTMRELRANEVSASTAVGVDWDASRHKEIDAWLNFGAGKVVKRKHHVGCRVLKTRWVYTVKPDGRKKSRLCVRGDIEKRQLARAGLTPSHESWAPSREADRLYYAITAEKKWDTRSSDYPNAFLQSDEDKLERDILLDLPKEAREYLDMQVDDVFLLFKNAYGTIDAPRAWQRTLQQEYEKQEFKIHPLIPTLFLLFDKEGRLEGHSKVHMDDSEYAGGTKRFDDKMRDIQMRFKVPDEKIELDKYVLCGRQIEQDPKDKTIVISLSKYAQMIDRIKTTRQRDDDDPLTPVEVTEVQRVIGQAIWYQSNAAPHASFRTSMLATMRAQKRYACIRSANELVTYIHKYKDFSIRYAQVAKGELDDLRVVAQGDASKSTVSRNDQKLPLDKMRLKGYAGRVFCLASRHTLDDQCTEANLVHWKSSKLDRVCTAPSSAETLAGVKTAYEGMALSRDLAIWVWGPTALEEATGLLQLTDSENLMENMRSDFPKPIDTLLIPDLLAMREHASEGRVALRWIDTRIMVADPLTKEFETHPALNEVCTTNKMQLVYVGENRKLPKHLGGWEPAWGLTYPGEKAAR